MELPLFFVSFSLRLLLPPVNFFSTSERKHGLDQQVGAGSTEVPGLQDQRLSGRGLHGGGPHPLPQAVRQVQDLFQAPRSLRHQRAPDPALL